jgi:hypothetical protein
MRLFVGIAYYDSCKMPTVMSLMDLTKDLLEHGIEFTVMAHRGPYVHHNREQLMRKAVEINATHLLFIDADVQFPAEGVRRLISHGKDVVGGNYPTKTDPPYSTVKVVNDEGRIEASMIPGDRLFKCWAVPTGFMLIDLEKCRDLPRPWFFFQDLGGGEIEGEDVWFCRQCNEAGLEVWCDPTIPLKHIGDYAYVNQLPKAREPVAA